MPATLLAKSGVEGNSDADKLTVGLTPSIHERIGDSP